MKNYYTIALCALALAPALWADAAEARRISGSRAVDGPVVKEATDITETGFTANWEPVAGAEGYSVLVWGKEVAPEAGTYTVLQEDFNLIKWGSVVEPLQSEDYYVDLSSEAWDCVNTPGWSVAGYAMFAGGKLNGVIYTPYMDLTNNGGKFTAVLGVLGYANQEIVVASVGAEEVQKKVRLKQDGYSELRVEFENGAHDSFLRIVDNGFPDADDPYDYAEKYAYLDDFAVEQDLKAGDVVLVPVDVNEGVEAPSTSADFSNLRFRGQRTELYYDVVAAFREYDDPDDPYSYEQWYSNYSALQQVLLKGHVGFADALGAETVIAATASGVSVSGAYGAVEVYTASGALVAACQADGTAEVALPAGFYLVKAGSLTKKVIVK